MKHLILLALLILTACKEKNKPVSASSNEEVGEAVQHASSGSAKDTVNTWTDPVTGKKYPLPDSIDGRHVSFYLTKLSDSSLPKLLYRGQFIPGDNDSTTLLLSYVTADDNTMRPFFRWCLDFTISMSDGALAEYPGIPALEYAEKFPEEFFAYMDDDPAGRRYNKWKNIIAYSGLEDYSQKNSAMEKEIVKRMMKKCSSCSSATKNRIKVFAKDIADAIKLQD